MNEEKEYERLKLNLNLALGRAMRKGLKPELIQKAMKDCAYCWTFNNDKVKFEKEPDAERRTE